MSKVISILILILCLGLSWYFLSSAGIVGSPPPASPPGTLATSNEPPAPEPMQAPEVAGNAADSVQAGADTQTMPINISERNINYICSMPPTRDVTASAGPRIYRWVDESGTTHFGDRPPASGEYERFETDLPARMDYFRLNVDFRGRNNVPFFRGRIDSQMTNIYEIFAELVGEQRLRQVDLNVLIFPDRPSYLDYARTAGGDSLEDSGGFYTTNDNEAVTYQYPDNEETLSVTRHESVHVIIRGVLGLAPIWLNEGLAAYFENFGVSNQVSRVSIHDTFLEVAQSAVGYGLPENLRDFLTMSDADWKAGNLPVNYALGWSLVYFLLSTAEGEAALSSLMQELTDSYCRPVDSAAVLARSYPGGLDALERDYLAWVRNSGNIRSHIY